MKKNCQLCNTVFTAKYNTKKNCPKHKGLFAKNHKYENGIVLRKCCRCSVYKELNSFYTKQGARGSSWCSDCFSKGVYKYQLDRALSRKIKAIKNKGGKCNTCGYNKNLSALVFHHLDPNIKDMSLDARTLGNNSVEVINKELDKCILLCHNCHHELHNPHLDNLL